MQSGIVGLGLGFGRDDGLGLGFGRDDGLGLSGAQRYDMLLQRSAIREFRLGHVHKRRLTIRSVRL